MFNVGDILKTNMVVAEDQYGGCKGTTVYNQMMALADKQRFEVIGVDNMSYTIKRLEDGQQYTNPKTEIHGFFILDQGTISGNI